MLQTCSFAMCEMPAKLCVWFLRFYGNAFAVALWSLRRILRACLLTSVLTASQVLAALWSSRVNGGANRGRNEISSSPIYDWLSFEMNLWKDIWSNYLFCSSIPPGCSGVDSERGQTPATSSNNDNNSFIRPEMNDPHACETETAVRRRTNRTATTIPAIRMRTVK